MPLWLPQGDGGSQTNLEIYEPEAKFVRMMYDLYLQGYGCVSIARHINSLGAKPHRASEFTRNSVAHILRNPTFAGKIVWDQKTHIRKGSKGNPKHITIYNPRESWTIVDGLHPAIIDQETYDKVQAVMAGRYIPSRRDGTVHSPLAGLVRCTNCGGHMQRMTMKGGAYLLCPRPGCCASAKFELVEHRVLSYLRDTLARLEMERQASAARDTSVLDSTLAAIKKELATASGQKTRLYELLEIGEYDIPQPSGSAWPPSKRKFHIWSAASRRPSAPSRKRPRQIPPPWPQKSGPSSTPMTPPMLPVATPC